MISMHSRKLLTRLRRPRKDPLAFLRTQKIYGRNSHLVATLLVLLTCLAATGAVWYGARKNADKVFQQEAEKRIEDSNQTIGNRLVLVTTVLSSGSGLFGASEQVTRVEWNSFIGQVYQQRLFPGVRAFGYVSYVKSGELQEHTTAMRQISKPDYAVVPVTNETDIHAPISFLAPPNTKRERVIGYNMYSNETRRNAINIARDSGKVSLSGKVDLVAHRNGTPSERGLILFQPIYHKNKPLGTVEQRRQNIMGFTYAVIVIDEMFSGVFGSNNNNDIGIEIYDNNHKSEADLMYRSENYDAIASSSRSFVKERKETITDHEWLITYAVAHDTLSPAERDAPFSTLLRGVVLSLALAFFVYYLLTYRTRKILEAKHYEVQSAKDDLLSLASHQLRTPATVVKQYVGMLLQGYGGELNDQQKNMLESAYTSNERQLQIINQILYVARLDAGQIRLHKERTNLNKLLKEVADEHRPSFRENKQKFNLRLPTKTIYIRGDRQYLHMVLDNLLSNAGKYTPPGGRVSTILTSGEGRATITVKDSGVGVTKGELAGIFDKFTRGTSEMTAQVSGSGIGLYLVKKITELHRGSIEARPNKPSGTIFELCLPLGISRRIKARKDTRDRNSA